MPRVVTARRALSSPKPMRGATGRTIVRWPSVATHRTQDEQDEDGADRREHQRAEPAGRLVLVEHVDPQEAADDAADDAHQHRADASHSLPPRDEEARQRAGKQADDDPAED